MDIDQEPHIMDIGAVKRFCLSFPGAQEQLLGEPANVLIYAVGGKQFAYFKTSEPHRWRFSIRVTPDRFIELTDQPAVSPARYLHRFHWVSILNTQAFDEQYLKQLIDWSYKKARASLPKKTQRILNE
nr:MmcQ/YjbR family DNA-binding protein [uncultured Pseudomonas sp.]